MIIRRMKDCVRCMPFLQWKYPKVHLLTAEIPIFEVEAFKKYIKRCIRNDNHSLQDDIFSFPNQILRPHFRFTKWNTHSAEDKKEL